jgi:hypothetical protein
MILAHTKDFFVKKKGPSWTDFGEIKQNKNCWISTTGFSAFISSL